LGIKPLTLELLGITHQSIAILLIKSDQFVIYPRVAEYDIPKYAALVEGFIFLV
jgi:hypothetical protein